MTVEMTQAQQAYEFTNPSFSGIGFSAHVLTLEQITQANRQRINEERAAEQAALERAIENSNLNKFFRNVESRIYAQISKQLVDAMFGDHPSSTGSIELGGNIIEYVNDGTDVTLTVTDPNGSLTTITIPIGDFGI